METEDSNYSYDVSLIEEGLMKYVCPKCNLIFYIEGKDLQCSSCGCSGSINFGIYPVLSAVDILYALYETVHIATLKQRNIIKKIQINLKSELHQEFEIDKIKEILITFCKMKESSYDEVGFDFDKVRGRIKTILALEDEDDLSNAFGICSSGNNQNRLYKSIVILSATFIEIIFKDYMEKVLITRTNSITASKIMESISNKSIEEHIKLLDPFLSRSLKDDLDEVELGYYEKWQTLRRQRNKLIHKNTIDISSKRAEEIFGIAKKSVLVFMKLNNMLK